MSFFNEINFENWDRKELYQRFSPCTYYLTVELSITEFLHEIKKNDIKFYPAINYCIAKVANIHKEFRFANIEGQIGYYDIVHPLYTVLRKQSDHLFTHKVTEYNDNFEEFYKRFLSDTKKAENGNRLYYDNPTPRNVICVSVMPNTSYKALSFSYPHIKEGNLIPFVSMGKYFNDKGQIKLPVTVEFHHEINDGYHADKFFHELERVCKKFRDL